MWEKRSLLGGSRACGETAARAVHQGALVPRGSGALGGAGDTVNKDHSFTASAGSPRGDPGGMEGDGLTPSPPALQGRRGAEAWPQGWVCSGVVCPPCPVPAPWPATAVPPGWRPASQSQCGYRRQATWALTVTALLEGTLLWSVSPPGAACRPGGRPARHAAGPCLCLPRHARAPVGAEALERAPGPGIAVWGGWAGLPSSPSTAVALPTTPLGSWPFLVTLPELEWALALGGVWTGWDSGGPGVSFWPCTTCLHVGKLRLLSECMIHAWA